MALVLETGLAEPLANTYVTQEQFLSYCTSVGDTAHEDLDQDQLDAALVRAARWLDRYSLRWVGSKSSRDQGLSWPRVNAVDSEGFSYSTDEVPRAVKLAQMAIAVLNINNALNTANNSSATPIISQREKIDGVLETEVVYATPTKVQATAPSVEIDSLLAGLLRSSYSNEIVRG